MTTTIRAQAGALFSHGMTPSQAHKELSKIIVEQKLPTMKSFQNRHRYFRKCKMLENSKPEVMARLLLDHYYNVEQEESQYFSFGYSIAYGRPSIGYNGPKEPFWSWYNDQETSTSNATQPDIIHVPLGLNVQD
ncbi:unnamed protein product [Aphanomyces euteiches]